MHDDTSAIKQAFFAFSVNKFTNPRFLVLQLPFKAVAAVVDVLRLRWCPPSFI